MSNQEPRMIIRLPKDQAKDRIRRSVIRLLKKNNVPIISSKSYMSFIVSGPLPEDVHKKINNEFKLITITDVALVARDSLIEY